MGFLTDIGRSNALSQQTNAITNSIINLRQMQLAEQNTAFNQQMMASRENREQALSAQTIRMNEYKLSQMKAEQDRLNTRESVDDVLSVFSSLPTVQKHLYDMAKANGSIETNAAGKEVISTQNKEKIMANIAKEPEQKLSLLVSTSSDIDNNIQQLEQKIASGEIKKEGDLQQAQEQLSQYRNERTLVSTHISQLEHIVKGTTVSKTPEQLLTQEYESNKITKEDFLNQLSQINQAKQKPLDLGDYRESKALELFNRRFTQLTPSEQQTVNNVTEEYNVRIAKEQAGARTTATIEAGLDEPIPIKEISNYFNPKTLQPIPKGTTKRQAQNMGAVYFSNEEIKNVGNMQKARAEFEQLGIQADRLLTATDTTTGIIQGTKLYGESFLPNTAAKIYSDTKNGYLGALSKAYAGETGVLTDRDIERIGKALPGFSDTQNSKNAKMAILRIIAKTAEKGAMAKIGGLGFNQESFDKEIQPLIDSLNNIDQNVPKLQQNQQKKQSSPSETAPTNYPPLLSNLGYPNLKSPGLIYNYTKDILKTIKEKGVDYVTEDQGNSLKHELEREGFTNQQIGEYFDKLEEYNKGKK